MHYFDRGHLPRFGDIGKGGPELARSFFAWYGLATGAGALPVSTKCLIGLAVAAVLQALKPEFPAAFGPQRAPPHRAHCSPKGQFLPQAGEGVC